MAARHTEPIVRRRLAVHELFSSAHCCTVGINSRAARLVTATLHPRSVTECHWVATSDVQVRIRSCTRRADCGARCGVYSLIRSASGPRVPTCDFESRSRAPYCANENGGPPRRFRQSRPARRRWRMRTRARADQPRSVSTRALSWPVHAFRPAPSAWPPSILRTSRVVMTVARAVAVVARGETRGACVSRPLGSGVRLGDRFVPTRDGPASTRRDAAPRSLSILTATHPARP